jgi:hypothetical protein
MQNGYGVTEGQLGAMKEGEISSVITSPPYGCDTDRCIPHGNKRADDVGGFRNFYSDDPANLGNPRGAHGEDTYWSAVAEIYRQGFLALKPGGYMACVVKSYVKAGKIVPLPEQTWELLQHVGFEPVERVRAMLVKEDSHPGLFDGPVVKKTERKSFFRRLAEKKGSPAIDFEEVLFLRKPL